MNPASDAEGTKRKGSSGIGGVQKAHPTWRLGRYLAAYRGNLTRGEAARRSGLPEVLWEKVEGALPVAPDGHILPAAIVAAMCVSIGADVSTGLTLAGHRPDTYLSLLERPAVFNPLTRGVIALFGPYIATPHVVSEALATASSHEVHERLASVYRHLAQSNAQVADQIVESPPDARSSEYWSGYADAVRAVAEQQAWAADQEEVRHELE